MHKFLFSAFGFALIMGGTTLSAQNENAQNLRDQLLQKYDLNKDGVLDEKEREAARAEFLKQRQETEPEEQPLRERRAQGDNERRRGPGGGNFGGEQFREQMLAVWDKDKDGELSEAERNAMREDFEKKRDAGRERFLAEYDANKNGEIDESERDAIRASFEKRREENEKKYDKDGSGDLNDEERRAMFEDFQKQREEVTKKYDTDGNGYLNFEEEEKARKDGAEIPGFGFGGGFGGPGGRRGPGGGDGGQGFRRPGGGGDGQGRPRRPGGGDGNGRPQRPNNTETN